MDVRLVINLTYRCNLHCKFCYQMFDVLPAGDETSDMSEEDLAVAAERMGERGLRVAAIKVSGGEPMLHPRLESLCEAIKAHWGKDMGLRVYTSGAVSRVFKKCGIMVTHNRIFVHRPASKAVLHRPMLISPADHGLEPILGPERPCGFQLRCGRNLDAYGFAPCQLAWARARLFGVDPYDRHPVLVGMRELCRHCLHSLGRSTRARLENAALAGEIDYPSPTYRKAIERCRNEGFPTFTRFLER